MATNKTIIAACGAACLAASAVAQNSPAANTPEPSADSEILVVGSRDRTKKISTYVRNLTVITADNPLDRYAPYDYCPGVVGLDDRIEAEIEQRMRLVAKEVGVQPAEPGCPTSALVIFVDDKKDFLKAFEKQHPVYFRNLRSKPWSLPKENGPAVAWHLTQIVDPQNMAVAAGQGGSPPIVQSSMGGSRINSMIRSVIAMSVVVIERKSLIGLSTTQIADYALMRTLSDAKPERLENSGAPTILTVLATPMGGLSAASVTKWDFAYLKGRYSGNPAQYGHSQGAKIRGEIDKITNQTQ